MVVTGSQTHFAQGVTTAAFGGGIQVTSVTVTGLLSATVGITIPNSVPLGAYNVSLTTGGEVATILGGFTVGTGSASISAVSPPTGTQGLTNVNVTLTGLFYALGPGNQRGQLRRRHHRQLAHRQQLNRGGGQHHHQPTAPSLLAQCYGDHER